MTRYVGRRSAELSRSLRIPIERGCLEEESKASGGY